MEESKPIKFWGLAALACMLLIGSATLALSETAEFTVEIDDQENESGVSTISEEPVYKTHTVLVFRNSFNPAIIEITQNETIVWRNLNRPKRTFVLVSKDKLWKDASMPYGRSFEYTFNETGTFVVNMKGEEDMEVAIIVREPSETGIEEREVPEPQIQPEAEEEEVTPVRIEERTVSENAVLIVGSAFYPETIELERGESLMWRNLNRPKRSFVLVSEEGLFENEMLPYGRVFTYTFEEAGTYTFRFEDAPGPELIVTVT